MKTNESLWEAVEKYYHKHTGIPADLGTMQRMILRLSRFHGPIDKSIVDVVIATSNENWAKAPQQE